MSTKLNVLPFLLSPNVHREEVVAFARYKSCACLPQAGSIDSSSESNEASSTYTNDERLLPDCYTQPPSVARSPGLLRYVTQGLDFMVSLAFLPRLVAQVNH